jgi:3-oxoacyl-[acyl-carrier-protein] synthase-3
MSDSETAAQLAARACEMALANAGLEWEDIDCLVATSATPDQALPYNAALVHAELGLSRLRTPTFDIGASCMSFLVGLDTLSYLVAAGRYENVMLVSADIATFGLDWRSLESSGIFGDGAAAAVIRATGKGEGCGILASRFITISSGSDFCEIPSGGSRFHPRRLSHPDDGLALFRMNGKAVFKAVRKELPGFVDELLVSAGKSMEEIQLVIPHQASRLAMDHLARELHIDHDRLVDIVADYGNQVGASLPTALHFAMTERRLSHGDTALLIGSGAGLTVGGMVLAV